MPLYEYTCQECEHKFETLVYNGEAVECPECHGEKLQRHWSIPAKPASESASLPMSCDPKLPPCGPGCCRM